MILTGAIALSLLCLTVEKLTKLREKSVLIFEASRLKKGHNVETILATLIVSKIQLRIVIGGSCLLLLDPILRTRLIRPTIDGILEATLLRSGVNLVHYSISNYGERVITRTKILRLALSSALLSCL
jgi:hypothetical protein